jgi:MerR family transcriptional regulator/heat shock protein HspR
MDKEYWTLAEVVEFFQIDEKFLVQLEEEEIVCPTCPTDPPAKLFSSNELENLRLAKVLVEDMGVNLAGVEIILRMRQNMFNMRKQFDEILEDLAQDLQEASRRLREDS